MAQLLTAPPSANLLASIPDQSKDSNATDAARLEAEAGTGSTFAAVLKTSNEKIQIRSGKLPPSTHGSSAPATSIKAGRVLISLHADTSIELKAPQRSLVETSADLIAPENLAAATLFAAPIATPLVTSATTTVGSEDLTDAQLPKKTQGEQLSILVDAIELTDGTLIAAPRIEAPLVRFESQTNPSLSNENSPRKALAEQLPKPLTSLANDQQPAIPVATPAGLISAVSPAPTFPLGKAGKFAQSEQKTSAAKSAYLLPEHGFIADKFAAKAAIAAETGKSVEMSFLNESGSGDFATVMDRGMQTSALAVMSPGQTKQDAAVPGLKLETPLGQAGWRDEFGQKLTWMVSNTRHQAELILNPPQLGRIEVTLTLDGDKASASFFSPHATVREALESSMTRLREVLAEAGVTLGQTHVGEDSRQNSGLMNPKHDEHAMARRNGELNFSAVDTGASGSHKTTSVGRGMVDIFA